MLYSHHSTITTGAFLAVAAVQWCLHITAGHPGVVLPYRFQSRTPLGWLTDVPTRIWKGYRSCSWVQELQSTHHWGKALYSSTGLVFISVMMIQMVVISSPVGQNLSLYLYLLGFAPGFTWMSERTGCALFSQNTRAHLCAHTHSTRSGVWAGSALAIVIFMNHHTAIHSRWPLLFWPNWIVYIYGSSLPKARFAVVFPSF